MVSKDESRTVFSLDRGRPSETSASDDPFYDDPFLRKSTVMPYLGPKF